MKHMKTILSVLLAVSLMLVGSTAFATTSRLGSDTYNFNPSRLVVKTAAYTVTTSDSQVNVTCSSANITITLPSVSDCMAGQICQFKILKTDATDYKVVVTPGSGDTVGGESTRYLVTQNAYMVIHAGPGRDWSVDFESPYTVEDYEAGTVNFNGLNSVELSSDTSIVGTTPSLTVGDGGDEDTYILFNGNTDDFYLAHDAADDDLNIGYGGSTEAEAGTQTAIEITDSATPAVSITNAFAANGDTTIGNAVTDDLTITAAIQGASPFVLDGTTDDTNELTVTLGADPGADYTLTVPATSSAAVMISALTTNDVDVANSVWGISNGIAFGGATGADGFELQVKPMGDPAADRSVLLPVTTNSAAMISALTTNDVNVANSVWGVSNGLAFGGATGADGFEVTLSPGADPGADVAVTLPTSAGALRTVAGLSSRVTTSVAGGSVTLTTADCGKTIISAGTYTFTLPATSVGCEITFTNGGADTNNLLSINPNDADQIWGVSLSNAAAAVDLEGAAGDSMTNTAATAERGDNVTLIADGVDGWYAKGFFAGIWADTN